MKNISIKNQLSLFLFAFLIFTSFQESEINLFIKSIIAVISCVAFDAVFSVVKKKQWVTTESSVVTGFIIGFVFSSYAPWWLFVLSSALAIGSKHTLRLKAKHIFNPAAFGIFIVVVLFHQATYWNGAYTWYLVIPFGSYFVWRIKKISIACSFLGAYILLNGLQSYWHNTSFIDQIIYGNYFLIFIMLIEPKTSPSKIKEQIAFGAIVCAISFVLYLRHFPYDADLPALLIGNLIFQLYHFKKEVYYAR